jgi:flagellar biosynthetic protein FliQ
MNDELVVTIGKLAIKTAFLIGAPVLITSMVIGILVSIFQAVTSISDITLTFVPKIFAVMLILAIFFPWMLHVIMDLTTQLFTNFPQYVK